jgi:hypothetical protein
MSVNSHRGYDIANKVPPITINILFNLSLSIFKVWDQVEALVVLVLGELLFVNVS